MSGSLRERRVIATALLDQHEARRERAGAQVRHRRIARRDQPAVVRVGTEPAASSGA
jgi:hypothetical protein